MLFLAIQSIILALLALQVKAQGGAVPKNVSQIRYGRVNVNDIIAYDLNVIFGSKKREEQQDKNDKYFGVNNKASRVISGDPFTIREFKEDCTSFNNGHYNTDYHMFTMICEKNKFYEIQVSKAIGATGSQIRASPYGIQFLGELKDPLYPELQLTCSDSTYYYEKQLYGVLCESPNRKDTRGDVLIFLIERKELQTSEVQGKELSLIRYPKSGKIEFSEKKSIKMVKFPMGTVFFSEWQFLIYDEPYIHQGHQTPSKDNLFVLIASVTGTVGNYKFDLDKRGANPQGIDNTARLIDFSLLRTASAIGGPIAEFNDLYRMVNVDAINGLLILCGYFDNITNMLSALKCKVDTSNSDKSFKIAACTKMKSKFQSELAFQQFFQEEKTGEIKKVATYSHKTKTIRVCNLMISNYETDAVSYEDGCAEIKARSTFVQDIAFGSFDQCDNENTCDALWFNEAKDKFIGIDRFKITKTEISDTGEKFNAFKLVDFNRYFCYGNSGRMIGANMFMAEEKFISGFNWMRSEEVQIKASLLPPGEDFYVTLYKHQANTHEFINITGYRVKQMIYQITGKQQFPKFRGSLGEMLRVPLGRDYFNGNALTFKLNANADIAANSHIHYLLPGKIQVEGEDINHKMFFYGHRSSVVVTSKWKLFFLKCLRVLEKDTIAISCTKITSKDEKGVFSSLDLGEGHNLVGVYESSEMHFVATNKGKVYRYNRHTREITEAYPIDGTHKVIEVTWKDYGDLVLVAMLSEDKKIFLGKISLFNENVASDISGKWMSAYDGKKSSQESPGDFCPNSIDFSQTYESQLMIVNSCPPPAGNKDPLITGKDRRLIIYDVTNESYNIKDKNNEFGLDTRNNFIRLKNLNGNKLHMCTDKEMTFVANIGTKYAYGIGLLTDTMNEDLGLDELNVEIIHKMLCLGKSAIGLIVTDTSKRLTVITYYLSKMRDTDNRVHSTFVVPGTFKDAVASEGHSLVFYNIYTNENPNAIVMAVELNGPNVYIRSDVREVAYETQIEVRNRRESQKFDILVDFEKLTKTAGFSHRDLIHSIEKKVYPNVETFSFWHGPVWSMTYSGPAGKIVEGRLSVFKTWVSANTADKDILSVDAIQYLDDKVFMLAQTKFKSIILITNDVPKSGEKPSVITLGKVCQNLRVVMNYMDQVPNGYLFLTNCFVAGGTESVIRDGPHPRLTYFKLSKVDTEKDQKPTHIVFNNPKDYPSIEYDLAFLKNTNGKKRILDEVAEQGLIPADRILQESGKEIMICFIHQHNRTMFMNFLIHGEQTGVNRFEMHELYRDENVHKIRLLDPGYDSDLIFALYYRIGDNSIRLKMVRKSTATIEDRDRLIVDRNDGTSFADFDCTYLPKVVGKTNEQEDLVGCIFATNGPFIYKVVYERNIFAGLIFKSRTKYELFSDNYPVKVAFNEKYIAVIAAKASTNQAKLLIYRDENQNGSRYLYAGIDLDKLSVMPASEFDLVLTNDDYLIVTINEGTKIVYQWHVRDLKIEVLDVKGLDKLKDTTVTVNFGSEYKETTIPFKYFFVHLSNQKLDALEAGGHLWGWIALIAFVIGTIIWAIMIKRQINKQRDMVRDSGVKYGASGDNVQDESLVGLKEEGGADQDNSFTSSKSNQSEGFQLII